MNDIHRSEPVRPGASHDQTSARHDWSTAEIEALFALPFQDLIFRAQQVHREHHVPNTVQMSTLLSIKTGACPEDCKYCPQSVRYDTGLEREVLMQVAEVRERAVAAKAAGATRFCMGAAWRSPKKKDVDAVVAMVREVRALGLETCATLGMVTPVGTFILAAAIKDAIFLMSARTSLRSKLLLIPSENVRDAFARDDGFARAIVVELASCYRAVVKEHKDLKLRSAVERLANRLLRFDRDQGGTGALELPFDKRTLASLLGMTPENLSRAFNTLRPYGVEVDGGTVRLSDRKALESLAKPNFLIDDPAS